MALFYIRVDALFERQLDVDADGVATAFARAAVAAFHNARPASRDDAETLFREQGAEFPGFLIPLVGLGEPRRTEERDRLFEIGQELETVHEFRHDTEHPPMEGMPPIVGVRSERKILRRHHQFVLCFLMFFLVVLFFICHRSYFSITLL